MKKIVISTLLFMAVSGAASVFNIALAQHDATAQDDPMLAAVPASTLLYAGSVGNKALADLTTPLRKRAIKSLQDDMTELHEQADQYGQAARFLDGLLQAYAQQVEQDKFIPGVGATPRIALYTIGIVPVIRIQLTDDGAFKQFLDKAEQLGGAQAQTREYDEIAFRTYTIGPDEAGFPAGLLVAVRPDFAVITADSAMFNDTVLPLALGLQNPPQSLTQNSELRHVVDANAFDYSQLAFINQQAIVAAVTGKDGSLATQMLDTLDLAPMLQPARDAACRDDLRGLALQWPLTAFGITSIQKNDDSSVTFVERIVSRVNNSGLMATLSKLRGHIPTTMLGNERQPLVSLALAVNMSQAAPVMLDLEQRFLQADFKCDWMVDAQQKLKKDDPVSLFSVMAQTIEDVQGVGVSIFGFNPDAADVMHAIDGLVTISTPQPRLVFKMAKMLVSSELAESAQFPEDGKSALLFPDQATLPPVQVKAPGEHLAFFMGAQATQAAEQLQDDELESNGIFYSHFDFAELARIAARLAPLYSDKAPGLNDDMARNLQQQVLALDAFDFDISTLIDINEHGVKLDFQGTINVPQDQASENVEEAPAT